jgi:hypothetical protein
MYFGATSANTVEHGGDRGINRGVHVLFGHLASRCPSHPP